MRKSVLPQTRISTLLSELPHVEIHKCMSNPSRRRSCITACGNTPKIVDFPTVEILMFWCISICRNSSRKVNFRMSIYKRICEFPQGKMCGNTQFYGDFHMRKYTRKCEFPLAEIHAERCITASGNTLNQVQKNSSIPDMSLHKIYRDEAVGLKSCKYTWKITIFVKMWNLGQYHENLIFCQ